MEAQGDGHKRCKFCEQGIRCSLCSQGPCRITEKAPRGVCGIDADGMAMRSFLLQNTMGTAAYTYHAGEVMKTLAQATPGGTYEIKDWSKLELLAGVVGEAVEPRDTLPKRVADADLGRVQPRPPEPVAARRDDGPGQARRSGRNSASCPAASSTRTCAPPRAA